MTRRHFLKSALIIAGSIPFLHYFVPSKYSQTSICPACKEPKVIIDNGKFQCCACGAEGKLMLTLQVEHWPEHILAERERQEKEFLRQYWANIFTELDAT